MLPRRADKTTERKVNEEVDRSDGQDVDNMKHQTSSLIPPKPTGLSFSWILRQVEGTPDAKTQLETPGEMPKGRENHDLAIKSNAHKAHSECQSDNNRAP